MEIGELIKDGDALVVHDSYLNVFVAYGYYRCVECCHPNVTCVFDEVAVAEEVVLILYAVTVFVFVNAADDFAEFIECPLAFLNERIKVARGIAVVIHDLNIKER